MNGGAIEERIWSYGMEMPTSMWKFNRTMKHSTVSGQGLLEHNRAVLSWLDGLLDRHPQLQSCTDQEEYLRLPALATGASAGVVPSQLAIWSYPRQGADADQASFNMVTAMLLRIHQSGNLSRLDPPATAQVKEGIRVYREIIREHIAQAVPFYPLGMPDVTDALTPIALGIKSPGRSFLVLWRVDGDAEVRFRTTGRAEILYPKDLGIRMSQSGEECAVIFPRPGMGCILSI